MQDNGGVWVGDRGVARRDRRRAPRRHLEALDCRCSRIPLVSVAIVLLAGEDLLDPWGVSWLWVAAVLGPVLGARTLLNPRPREPQPPASP